MRRTADCVERGYFGASRLGVRRCFYRLGVVWWVCEIEMVLRCVARDCIEGGYFRASRLGVRRCFYRLGSGWWVYTNEMVLKCVARLTASREATLGRRVSECVVAFTVLGLGGGCMKLRWS